MDGLKNKQPNIKERLALASLLVLIALLGVISFYFIFHPELNLGTFALLEPKGIIALKERNLLITATLIMLIAVVPVYILIFYIAKKYRGIQPIENPEAHHTLKNEVLIWVIPTLVIAILAVFNWKSTHELDPYKPILSDKKPITIQVVALDWKWLFIYPEENIATVNFIQFPVNTPLNFELTADAPMNSFWIPQLGGQMYAMAGMTTKHHLIANETGDFAGSAAEINGKGFAGMRFVARASTETEYAAWIESVKSQHTVLDLKTYEELAKPTENHAQTFYSHVDLDLYDNIVGKFMMPMD